METQGMCSVQQDHQQAFHMQLHKVEEPSFSSVALSRKCKEGTDRLCQLEPLLSELDATSELS